MADRNLLWSNLLESEKKARASRLSRFLHNPILYPSLLTYGYILYPKLKKDISTKASTFFGTSMKTLLPAGTDIKLNGIKSHDSEIRLSKYLALTLRDGDTFIDIGAHYGYYSLLASVLVGRNGQVHSIEPTNLSYALLKENTSGFDNITTYQAAAGNKNLQLTFYEYPGPYSEYNTIIPNAYEKEAWSKKIKPLVTTVNTVVIDELLTIKNITKAVIKIDVEGGEPEVVEGLNESLSHNELIIIMEYLKSGQNNSPHNKAVQLLNSKGYSTYVIEDSGILSPVEDIDLYMANSDKQSDNIVFAKEKSI